jgi:hypothetical protein
MTAGTGRTRRNGLADLIFGRDYRPHCRKATPPCAPAILKKEEPALTLVDLVLIPAS